MGDFTDETRAKEVGTRREWWETGLFDALNVLSVTAARTRGPSANFRFFVSLRAVPK